MEKSTVYSNDSGSTQGFLMAALRSPSDTNSFLSNSTSTISGEMKVEDPQIIMKL